jgi:hypothetical protein
MKLSRRYFLILNELLPVLLVKSRNDEFVTENRDGFVSEVGRVGDEEVDRSLTGLGVGLCERTGWEGAKRKGEKGRTSSGVGTVEEEAVSVDGLLGRDLVQLPMWRRERTNVASVSRSAFLQGGRKSMKVTWDFKKKEGRTIDASPVRIWMPTEKMEGRAKKDE